MLRKIGFTLLCAAAILTTNANATVNHALVTGVTIDYDLPPNDPQLFTNYMFWPVEATCKITTEDASNELFIEALAKKGKINDVVLSKGETMNLTVHPDDSFKLGADSGAQVRITNKGLHTVKASCTAGA